MCLLLSLSEIWFDSYVKWHERIISAIVTHFLPALIVLDLFVMLLLTDTNFS